MASSIKGDSTKTIQVVRYNNRVIYIFGLIVMLIVVAAFVALSSQRNNGLLKYAEVKEVGAPLEPWYKNKANSIEITPTPLPELQIVEQPHASLIQQKEPEDLSAKRKREEEFQAIRASSLVAVVQPSFKSATGKPLAYDEKQAALDSLLLNGLSKPQENKPTAEKSFLECAQNDESSTYLNEKLETPRSFYELKAGSVIPAAMLSGINSELPGQIVAQVTQNVYDTTSGRFLLIPQGSRLIGTYDSDVTYGQERVLVAWKRLIFPNGRSITLKGMPGVDEGGYAGFNDQVNNHYSRIFGSAVMMSFITAGVQLSQPEDYSYREGTSPGQEMAAALGQQLGQVSAQMIQKNLNISPTLEIRPGYLFNVMVTKDAVFPGAYVD